MYLKSVNGLNIAIQQTELYKSKRPTAKKILIDRCNFLINSIVDGNRHKWNVSDYEAVPLNREILKQQLGNREYTVIKDLLSNLGYINIGIEYISPFKAAWLNKNRIEYGLYPNVKTESKKYSLTDKAKDKGIVKVGVLSPKTESRLLKYKSSLLKTYLKDKQIHSKIIFNLTELHFQNDKAVNIYNEYTLNNDNLEQALYYQNTFNVLKKMNTYSIAENFINCQDFYYTQSKLVNRVFHYYSTIPKQYREFLKHKTGGQLAEIDLKNSQPFIIVMNYINGLFAPHNILNEKTKKSPNIEIDKMKGKGGKGKGKEIDGICGAKSFLDLDTQNLLDSVLNGTFYKVVAEHGLKQGNKDYYNLYLNDYSTFKGKVLGEGLYFNLIPKDKIKESERYLLDMYPNFMEWVRKTKSKKGYKSISINAQITESDLFINDLFLSLEHEKHFAVPFHDSIIVKADEVNFYLDRLINIFENRFEMLDKEQIKKLFRISLYNE